MYKYIIYCSISAVIIIAAKYVYQNWIKQNHTIATIKQDILLLQNKVKTVEDHFEKSKASMSGGVTVPIVFKKLDTQEIKPQSPIQTKNVVELKNDLQSESVSSISEKSQQSNYSNKSTQSNVKESNVKESNVKVINLNEKKELLDDLSVSISSSKSSGKKRLLNLDSIKDLVEPKQSVEALEAELDLKLSQKDPELLIDLEKTPKKSAKKKSLPDAKDYNNGDKITDDQGYEYLCIVGKRGGHSWQKLDKKVV